MKKSDLNADLIASLKKKHGELFLVEVDAARKGEPKLQFVFKKPDRKVLSASSKFAISDPIKAAEVAITNCLVFGDEKALDDIAVFQAVAMKFEEINKAREATLKNL